MFYLDMIQKCWKRKLTKDDNINDAFTCSGAVRQNYFVFAAICTNCLSHRQHTIPLVFVDRHSVIPNTFTKKDKENGI